MLYFNALPPIKSITCPTLVEVPILQDTYPCDDYIQYMECSYPSYCDTCREPISLFPRNCEYCLSPPAYQFGMLGFCSSNHKTTKVYGYDNCTTLSGANGEWTMADDVKDKRAIGKKMEKKIVKAIIDPSVANVMAVVAKAAANAAVSKQGREVLGDKKAVKIKNILRGSAPIITGKGDYNVSGLDMDHYTTPVFPPTHGHTFSFCEQIDLIVAKTLGSFTNQIYSYNPGLMIYPQASQMMCNYSKYKVTGLVISFESTCQYITNVQASGTVGILFNPNPDEPAFSDYESFVNFEGSRFCRFTDCMLVPVECDPRKALASVEKMVRTGSISQTRINYDFGSIQFMINQLSGVNVDTPLGVLKVSHRVEGCQLRLWSTPGNNMPYWAAYGTTPSTSNLLGTNFLVSSRNTIPIVASTSGTTRITLPGWFNGSIRITVVASATTSVTTLGVGPNGLAVTAGTIVALSDLINNLGTGNTSSYSGTGGTSALAFIDFTILPAKANANFFDITGTVTGTGLSCMILVQHLNPLIGPPAGPSTNYIPYVTPTY